MCTPSTKCFLEHNQVYIPNGTSIGSAIFVERSAIFVELMIMTDRQTTLLRL